MAPPSLCEVCAAARSQSRRAPRPAPPASAVFPAGPGSPATCRELWSRRRRRHGRPAARGRKRKRPATRPRPRPAPAARRGASTDVSLGRGAALRSGLGRGQRHPTRSAAEHQRDPGPEQPPPWRVSPSGQPRRLGKARIPLPLAGPGERPPRRARPGALRTGPAPPAAPRGPREPPRAPAPLVPAPARAGREASRGAQGAFPALTLLCLSLQSQVSGSHQALLCHPAGNSEAGEEGRFPIPPPKTGP